MADELDTHEKRHGIMGDTSWDTPVCVTDMGSVQARLTFTDVKAHEYVDTEDVLREKVALLSSMIRESDEMITYTGAGISVAAGIDDYATKVKDASITRASDVPRVKDWKDARPTVTHRVLTAMYESGYLKHWIQQNHDSLPQKAGFPQSSLNEIHGSLHDPANPVVPYEGTLRDDLYAWLRHWEERNDLVLALGTSMSGFNCDSVPARAAEKFSTKHSSHKGLVIINLQRTPYDEVASLRIYAKVDTVLPMLAEALGIDDRVRPMDAVSEFFPAAGSVVDEQEGSDGTSGADMFVVPFNGDTGEPDGSGGTVWDLRPQAWLRLTGGPYSGCYGQVIGRVAEGHWRIRFSNCQHPSFPGAKMKPFSLFLGKWWVEEATRGRGIFPGGKIPFVSVTAAEAEASTSSDKDATLGSAAEEQTPSALLDLSKYDKLVKIGMAMGAVEQRMMKDGVPNDRITAFCTAAATTATAA
mmetsp:Transcript_17300/g.31429  ORF Transcript_17300/g.31429 Transcript_17300/m.31429 type:complete len:470 (+) Transcript_17300:72-1481(+)